MRGAVARLDWAPLDWAPLDWAGCGGGILSPR
ncbi:hypothetical protein Pla86_45900 [Planctomycetes bacterium Pla86]|uniref:Uncharacterized protein n=1 Tax=Engelhardtia mirabilis TaxID=2528011 RepID=A0A518BR69_9BACT|nr:hypothetical protein Pla133_45920 [Planctomycetes bacterium Pla133]QDV03798.1 hypothetical protein Pla86_45900 [Planctomycetes bacterium Pla86]